MSPSVIISIIGVIISIVAQVVAIALTYGALREKVSNMDAHINERLAAGEVLSAAQLAALTTRIEQVADEQRENGKALYMLAGQRQDIERLYSIARAAKE